MKTIYIYVLLLIGARNYAWSWFPAEVRGSVSKALGAFTILCLLLVLYKATPSRPLALVVAYGAFEELQTVICSVAYAMAPWPVELGQSICSARLDFDLGAIGVMLLAFTLHIVCQPAIVDRIQKREDGAS